MPFSVVDRRQSSGDTVLPHDARNAKRGIAIVSCLFVCLSVCLSIRPPVNRNVAVPCNTRVVP